ncbi:hypothetical protein MLD38_023034 [Melastoma candidum]|uniref:Uncharacterized protein n=1 Tax=Melastoma candidum TaxID=119954 RepID=A0ACB9QKD1_9MYRT|nr:hypothetical protein MLD38_023034 [Melastoma candidum]
MTSSLSSHIHHATAAVDDEEEEETSLFPDPIHSSSGNPPGSPSPAYHHHRLPSVDATVTIRLLPSQGLSFQLWPSSLSLLSSLSSPLSSLLPFSSPHHRPLRILELGSGAGLVGISYAAALGAHVTVTDLPHVLPNLLYNVDLNSSVLRESGGEVSVAQLRWGEIEDVEKVGREFDLVLAADVVYYDYLYEPLLKTLKWLLEGKGRDEMVFVMGHVRRWKKDNLFFRKARKWFDVEVLRTDRESHPGSRSGVIVYRFSCKAQHPSIALSSDVNGVSESVH